MKDRVVYLDYARAFAAYLVAYGHLYDFNPNNYVRSLIYAFHLPLFFLVSGILHKYKGQIQLKKYAKTMLVPSLFYSILFFIPASLALYLGYLPAKSHLIDSGMLSTFVNNFVFMTEKVFLGTDFYNGPCWFLVALFYCKIFTDMVEKNRAVGFFLWLILFVCLTLNGYRYLFVAQATMAMPFYYIGFQFKEEINKMMSTRINPMVYVVLIGVFAFVVYKLKVTSMLGVYFGRGTMAYTVPLFYLNAFIGSFLVLKFSTLFKKESVVSKTAYSLLSILGLQSFFTIVCRKIGLYDMNYVATLFVALAIYVLCHIGHKIIVRYMPFALGKF